MWLYSQTNSHSKLSISEAKTVHGPKSWPLKYAHWSSHSWRSWLGNLGGTCLSIIFLQGVSSMRTVNSPLAVPQLPISKWAVSLYSLALYPNFPRPLISHFLLNGVLWVLCAIGWSVISENIAICVAEVCLVVGLVQPLSYSCISLHLLWTNRNLHAKWCCWPINILLASKQACNSLLCIIYLFVLLCIVSIL